MQGGKAVNVWYMVPVTFSLGSSSTNSSNQESQFSKSSLTEILKYVVEHTVYPQEARNSSDTGRVFVAVRMNKGGTLNGTVTFSEKNEVNVPVLPQIVIIGYKVTSGPGGISNKPGHPALRAECVRVANQLGDLDIPEWKDKNMEFALAFKFVLE